MICICEKVISISNDIGGILIYGSAGCDSLGVGFSEIKLETQKGNIKIVGF